jgi:hypothetical protein
MSRPAQIDVEQVRRHRAEQDNWDDTARAYNAAHGTSFPARSLYHAVWQADRKRKRPHRPLDDNDRSLRDHWRPVLPRPLRNIPDYRTDTVRRN